MATTVAWVVAAILPVAAHAAGSLSRPVLGYVFEPAAKAIRPIAGVPGAAVLDDALPNASKIETAFVAPGRTFAIAEILGEEASALIRWQGREASVATMAGSLRGATLAAFSSGEFAAIYYKEAGRVQVWRGLPESPAMLREFSLPEVRSLAISPDATLLAASTPAGLLLVSESATKLLAGGEFTSVAFAGGSHDVVAVEPGLDRLIRFREGEGNFAEVAGSAQGLASPKAVAISGDGKTMAIVNERGSLVMVDVAAGTSMAVRCDCSPSSALTLSGAAVFLIGASDGSQWVLDYDNDEPRLVFAGGIQ